MSDLKEDGFLKALLQHSNAIIICLTTGFSISGLSHSAEKFYNWQAQKVRGKNFLELCQASGYTRPIELDFFKNPIALKINLYSKNSLGKQKNINWIISPIVSQDNNVDGVVLVGENVDLKENNIAEHLNEIIDCIPGCLYWKDVNGHYLGCNKLTAELAGLKSIYDIVGKTDEELWGKQANFLASNDQQVLTSAKTITVEEKLQAADGRWLSFTGIKMPLKDENNKIIGIIGNSLDITELKATQTELKKSKEKAEALSRAKSEFIANMSHDVKTPLSGIIGLSEILHNTLVGKEADLIQSIFLSGQQLMTFFDNCLDMAKSEQSDITLITEHFNLKSLLNQVVDLFQPSAQNKNLEFYFYYDNKIPASLLGSRVGIYRVLINLVGNAIKFTQHGSISIHVKISKRSTAKHLIVRFIVEDTGIGIPHDKQKTIFEKFTRLIPSYQGIYEGSGLGLHIVNKFVKSMEGEVYVNSEEGNGSRFVVVLPLEASLLAEEEYEEDVLDAFSKKDISFEKQTRDSSQFQTEQSNNTASNANIEKLSRVLLVEDSLIAQQVAQIMLGSFSDEIHVADNGKKAVELFKAGKYDLVLMDIGLPDMPGYEVTKILRKMEEGTPYHVPIIALTAHASDLTKEECISSGMEDVCSKPLSEKQIKIIIEQYILSKDPLKIIRAENKSLPVISAKYSKEVLDALMQILPEFCKDMEKAYKTKAIDELIDIVHKFHGGVCYTNTPQLLAAARDMETALRSGKLNSLEAFYQNINSAIKIFEETYKSL